MVPTQHNTRVTTVMTRVIACILAIAISGAPINCPVSVSAQPTPSFLAVDSIRVPEAYGSIATTIPAHKSAPLLITIQDAHAHYEVQHNIVRLIRHLQEQYAISTVLVEGYEGMYDLSLFRAFPVRRIRDTVIDSYLRSGDISGPEAYAICAPQAINLVGIDQTKRYLEHVALYGTIKRFAEAATPCLETLHGWMQSLEQTHFSDALKTFCARREAFLDGRDRDSVGYLQYLIHGARVHHISLSALKTLNQLLTPTPSQHTDITQLMREREVLEERLAMTLCTSREARDVYEMKKNMEVIRALLLLKARSHEVDYFRHHEKAITDKAFSTFFETYLTRPGFTYPPSENFSLDKIRPLLKRFYTLAESREKSFVHQSLRYSKHHNVPAVILVTGGYHAAGIVRACQDQHVSSLVIKPRVHTVSPVDLYENLMQRSDISYDAVYENGGDNVKQLTALMVLPGGTNYAVCESLRQRFACEATQQLRQALEKMSTDEIKREGGVFVHALDGIDPKRNPERYFEAYVQDWNAQVNEFVLVPLPDGVQIIDAKQLVALAGEQHVPFVELVAELTRAQQEQARRPRTKRTARCRALLKEIAKEQHASGTGTLPYTVVLSDYHGAADLYMKYIADALRQRTGQQVVLDDKTYPRQSIREQLTRQQIDFKNIGMRFYLLGDLLDRGPEGIKCFYITRELVEGGVARYVTGNHDLWAFMNLFGFGLPAYRGYNFYGHESSRRLVEDVHWDDRDITADRIGWWTKKLALYNAAQQAFQRESLTVRRAVKGNDLSGEAVPVKMIRDEIKKILVGIQVREKLLKEKIITAEERSLLEDLAGYYFGDTDVYTGFNSVGMMSVQWWQERLTRVEQWCAEARTRGTSVVEIETWQNIRMYTAAATAAMERRFNAALERGEWWWRVFNDINHQNYASVEWYANDWSSHAGWGTSVIKELNVLEQATPFGDGTWSQENYIKNPHLQKLAQFYRSQFTLYIRDAYGNLYTHGWLPLDDDGLVRFTYKNKRYEGTNMWEGFDLLQRDIRDLTKPLSELHEALALINSWYADATTRLKPKHIEAQIHKHGLETIYRKNGIGRCWCMGHNPLNKLHPRNIGFIVKDRGYVLVSADKGMSWEKFNDYGGVVIINGDGIVLRGYVDANFSTIIASPPTIKHTLQEQSYVTETIWENAPLERKVFLSIMQRQLREELACGDELFPDESAYLREQQVRDAARSIGVSVRGTRLIVALLDGNHDVVRNDKTISWDAFPHLAQGRIEGKGLVRRELTALADEVIAVIVGEIKKLCEQYAVPLTMIQQVTVSIAAPVDDENGIVGDTLKPILLPFDNYQFRGAFIAALHRTGLTQVQMVPLFNDTKASLLGEQLADNNAFLADNEAVMFLGSGANIYAPRIGNVEAGHNLVLSRDGEHYQWIGKKGEARNFAPEADLTLEERCSGEIIRRRFDQIRVGADKYRTNPADEHFALYRDCEEVAAIARQMKRPGAFEYAVTQAARRGNVTARAFIEDIGTEIGRALAAFIAGNELFDVRRIWLVGGVHENMGRDVFEGKNTVDIYMQSIRYACFAELVEYYGMTEVQDAWLIAEGIVRSTRNHQREFYAGLIGAAHPVRADVGRRTAEQLLLAARPIVQAALSKDMTDDRRNTVVRTIAGVMMERARDTGVIDEPYGDMVQSMLIQAMTNAAHAQQSLLLPLKGTSHRTSVYVFDSAYIADQYTDYARALALVPPDADIIVVCNNETTRLHTTNDPVLLSRGKHVQCVTCMPGAWKDFYDIQLRTSVCTINFQVYDRVYFIGDNTSGGTSKALSTFITGMQQLPYALQQHKRLCTDQFHIIQGMPQQALQYARVLHCVENVYETGSTYAEPRFTKEAQRELGFYLLRAPSEWNTVVHAGSLVVTTIQDLVRAAERYEIVKQFA